MVMRFRLLAHTERQIADGEEWPDNCVFFQTIMSNTVSGVECDASRIYDHAHPYPKKPGNVVATFTYSLAWEEVPESILDIFTTVGQNDMLGSCRLKQPQRYEHDPDQQVQKFHLGTSLAGERKIWGA